MLSAYETEYAQRHLRGFTEVTMPKFDPSWFHRSYYDKLDQFSKGKIKFLMVFVPPQHGKSEGSTRRLPAKILGDNPNKKIAIISYSASKARKFNREIQRVIDTPEYRQIYPDTTLAGPHAKQPGEWVRNNDEVEIVGYEGGFKTVGVGGPLTGDPVDILIMDDIYKDAKSAWSPTIRQRIEDWYDTVADSRLHNDSQVLIVFTRWHEYDLAGKLLKSEGRVEDGGKWTVVTYPALKVGPANEYDPRSEGEALWPERHNAEKLKATQKRNKHAFESLWQQNPKPIEGLLYKKYNLYRQLPSDAVIRKAVCDTADEGKDYLCNIIYATTPYAYFLLDVYYTQDGMEVTEDETALRLSKFNVTKTRIESNNGGRSFARNVERQMRLLGNHKTEVEWYHQNNNKQVRIFTEAAEVQNMIYYPEEWDLMWPEFHQAVTTYQAQGNNEHDDAEDTLTMIIEAERNGDDMIYSS